MAGAGLSDLLGRSDREAYKRPHLSPVLSARRYLFPILHVSGNDSLRVGPDIIQRTGETIGYCQRVDSHDCSTLLNLNETQCIKD